MHSFNKIISGVALVTTMAVAGVAGAATIQVDGSLTVPVQNGVYQSINDAITSAQTGDTVQVAAGHYVEAVNITKGIILLGSGPQYTFLNNTLTVNTTDAVKIAGFNISSQSNTGNGISVATPSAQLDISNNCIVGNTNHGINYYPTGTSATPIHYLNITNNTISNNGNQGAYIAGSNLYGLAVVTITNNIFSGNTHYGVDVGNSNGNSGTKNIFYLNNSPNAAQTWGFGAATASLTGDPLFADNISDFTLQVASPGRFAGTISASYLNPDGTQSDLGAYGGPGAAAFWPYGYGPIVTSIGSDQQRVTQGASITINATATVR